MVGFKFSGGAASGILLLAVVLLAGCQSSTGIGPSFTPIASASPVADFKAVGVPSTAVEADNRLGAGDVVTVTVFQVPELSSQSSKVSSDGSIVLPLVGSIRAGGSTIQQVTDQIRTKLTKFVQSPQVSVTVTQSVSQSYTVDGEINQPGTFPLSGGRSLLRAIASAGGFNQVADRSDITVYRRKDGQKQSAKYDVDAIRNGSAQDPVVLSGDVIVVGASPIRSALQQVMPATPLGGLGAQVGERVAK